MKRVKIYAYKVGLVFREGNFIKVLKEGSHWLWWSDEVKIYDVTEQFIAPCELEILLQNHQLAQMLNVIEVEDNELAFQYKHSKFQRVLTSGRYVFWKSVVNYEFTIVDLNEMEIPKNIDKKIIQRASVMPFVRVYVVESFETGLLFIDGKFVKVLESGIHYYWKNEKAISILKADLRQQQMEISGQEILTKDKAALRVNFYAQYKIVDVEKALVETKDFAKQLYITLQLGLRDFIGTMTLDELLARKENIHSFIMEAVQDRVTDLGTELINCGIRDVILPGEVKEIMNQVLIAQKAAQANIITRREETASTRSLLNTAKLMEDNEMLFKLKEMEYVEKIAEKISNISLSGSSRVVDQLKDIFTSGKN